MEETALETLSGTAGDHRAPQAPQAPEPPGALGALGRRPGQPPAHPLIAGSRKFAKNKKNQWILQKVWF